MKRFRFICCPKQILGLALILISLNASSQSQVVDTLFKQDVLDIIHNSPDSVVEFTNLAIVDNYKSTDYSNFEVKRLLENKSLKLKRDSIDIPHFEKEVIFTNCSFLFERFCHISLKSLSFRGVHPQSLPNLVIETVHADALSLNIAALESLEIDYSKFKGLDIVLNRVEKVYITDNSFAIDKTFYYDTIMSESGKLFFNEPTPLIALNPTISLNNVEEFHFMNNEYTNRSPLQIFTIMAGGTFKNRISSEPLDNLLMTGNEFDGIFGLKNLEITTNLHVSNNIFHRMLILEKFNYSEVNNFFPYSQVKRGIGYLENIPDTANRYNQEIVDGFIYHGRGNQPGSENSFNELMSIYNKVLTIQRDNGDLKSANLAINDIKEIQKNRWYFEYVENPTFENFFRWQLAVLLKYYVRYGTSPAQALVLSFYIILLFAVFYFFFPSEWDKTSKKKLIKTFNTLREKNDNGYIKPFMYLLWGFITSLLNAITLSLNSFVTLGFGTIPTRGIARYVCIIQGFIGWFLLSIFTVALINQVIT